MARGVNHGVRKSEEENIRLVRVDCHCGNSNLIDRSCGQVSMWHKVRVGSVGGRVRVFCDKCEIEYLIKGVSDVEVEQISEGQNLDSVVDGLGDDLDQEELDSPPFFDDPVIDDYMNKLFGVTPIDPKKEDEELSAKLDRAIKIARKQVATNHMNAFVGGSDNSATIVATLAAAVLAKMR